MIRSLVFTTQGRLHSRNIEMLLMPTLLSDTNLFLWVDLESATPEETKYVLEEVFHFHPLSIEDCIAESPSPKVEDYSPREEDQFTPCLFIVIHAVDYSRKDGVFATRELDFFLGENYLVTYHTGPLKSVTVTEERAVKGTMLLARAPDRVAHGMLDSIVENYKPALDELSLEIAERAKLDTEPNRQYRLTMKKRIAREGSQATRKDKPSPDADAKAQRPRMTRELAEARAVGSSSSLKFNGTAFLQSLKK